MGEGGNLVLVNGTKYAWSTTGQDSHQMNSWPFPVTLDAGQTASLYVEWDQNILATQSDDAANATMSLQGTPAAFQLQARNTSQFDLLAALTALSTQNNPQGSVIDLGWPHNTPPNANVPLGPSERAASGLRERQAVHRSDDPNRSVACDSKRRQAAALHSAAAAGFQSDKSNECDVGGDGREHRVRHPPCDTPGRWRCSLGDNDVPHR